MSAFHVGIDVGGTFTDFVALHADSGELYRYKRCSTRPPDQGVLQGLSELAQLAGFPLNRIDQLLHGSTVATNALLEKKLARTALLTTEGFGDILEIGRQDRPQIYDWNADRPEPLVPRALRFEVPERLDYQGQVLKKLDLSAITHIAEVLRQHQIESVAVCYLFSYLNPAHERQTGEALRACLSIPVTLSSELLPEYREYERTATTVLSAALRPIVEGYLSRLTAATRQLGIKASLQVMQSNGGLAIPSVATARAVQMLLSGPAAGVIGARYIGSQAKFQNLITLDMGGTSTDVALIRAGVIAWRPEGAIDSRPVRLPMVDLQSIGAGGGSIAWLDAGKALRVGPQSAGAEPGPACYGVSDLPTITDAQVVLGRLDPERPLGSRKLDAKRAQSAIYEQIARPLGLSVEEAALGILAIADAHMERAIRLITVERGLDPRDFTLFVFGGAGPLHGTSLAQRLKIRRVFVPQLAGVLAAFGLLVSEPACDLVQTFIQPLHGLPSSAVQRILTKLKTQAEEYLPDLALRQIDYFPSVDLRYRGQSYEINLALDETLCQNPSQWGRLFHQQHRALYSYDLPERPVEVVNIRLRAVGRRAVLPVRSSPALQPYPATKRYHSVYFRERGWVKSAVYYREELLPEMELRGPALITGLDSTILIEPQQRASVDKFGNLLIEL